MILPAQWSELSIGQYQKAHEVFTTTYEDELDRQIALMAALAEIPEEKIMAMPADEIKDGIQQLAFLRDLNTIPTKIPKWVFMSKGLYRIQTDIRKLTAGQYIDLSSFIKQADGDIIPQLHNLMAVLTTPVCMKYDGHKHREIADLIQKHMSIVSAYPVALFFCSSYNHFTQSIRDYSSREVEKARTMLTELKQELETDLRKDTAGSLPSMRSRNPIKQNGNSSSK